MRRGLAFVSFGAGRIASDEITGILSLMKLDLGYRFLDSLHST